jgi:autotransporter-associated beta strand protein
VATTNSSYTGATIITENTMNEGGSEEGPGLGYQTVALGANNALSTTGELVLGVKAGTAPISGVAAPAYTSNGVFDMAGYSQTVSGLATGSGTTASANYIGNNSGAGVSTLTVSGTSTPSSGFGGTIQDNLGTTGGKVAVALASGVLKLTGANSYSGGTTVTTGSLQITSNTGLGTGATTVTGGSGGAGTLDLQGVTVTTPINLSGSSSTNTANLINSIVSYSQTPVFGYSAGTTNITLPNVAGLSVGEAVSGTGFSNDVISAINGNVITLTTPTSSGSGGSPMPVTAGTPSVISSASSVTLVGAAANNNIGGAGSLTINATIADGASSGGFTKIGNAGLTLGGANTYTGATVAGAGVIDLANSLALQDSTLTTTANTGGVTFDSSVSSQAFTLGGLSGTGTLGLNDTANNAVALTVGNNNASTTYNGVLSGSGSVSKVGTGSLALGGSNTYSGNTSVTGGKLYVNNTTGSGTGGGNVTTTSSGGSHPVLAGSGSIAPTAGHTVTIGAGTTLSSGDVQVSDATHETITGTGLTVVNSSSTPGALLSINGGATLQFALGAGANTGDFNYANPNKDSTYMTITGDQVGEINFGLGSAINVNLVDLTALYSSQLPANQLQLRYENPVLLISAGLDSDYANLVTTGGLDQNGYVLGVGTSLTNYTAFNITVSDINNNPITSYNDLNLYLYNGQLEVIPEPSTWAMLILSLAGLGFCTWSKRRSVRVTSA